MSHDSKILSFETAYPSKAELRRQAKKRLPEFAFDYLEGGCIDDICLERNILYFSYLEGIGIFYVNISA